MKAILSVALEKFQTLQAETGLHVLTAKYTGVWGRSHQFIMQNKKIVREACDLLFEIVHKKEIYSFKIHILLMCFECPAAKSAF